ncbi:hypothetical protein Sme01_00430 [Sphaerisporangium melleum]|uniref:Uncharacterized protein n=1 Tax=Sphaerisporangium melleum TaxID=321316 RepID=A0A917VS94_9ACTN|nr:hypothetical protein GCM10007964_59650 [Sphaerisporangium melleum]GII67567.1 hypothetical protein Sme01_00430 [Sphaerisporangium melleum]
MTQRNVVRIEEPLCVTGGDTGPDKGGRTLDTRIPMVITGSGAPTRAAGDAEGRRALTGG